MYLCYSNLLLIVNISNEVTSIYWKSTFSGDHVRNFPRSRLFEFLMPRKFRLPGEGISGKKKSRQTHRGPTFHDPGGAARSCVATHRSLEPRAKRMGTLVPQLRCVFPTVQGQKPMPLEALTAAPLRALQMGAPLKQNVGEWGETRQAPARAHPAKHCLHSGEWGAWAGVFLSMMN